MPSVIQALRAFHRALLRRSRRPDESRGIAAVLDGCSAVATVEACAGQVLSGGASRPADAGEAAWCDEQQREIHNAFGAPLSTIDSDNARGSMAAAIGLSLSGCRATTFLSGPDVSASQDQMMLAAGRHLPLTAYLACRAPMAHGTALGTGHEAVHAASDSGWLQLFAANVQEAVDFGLIGRRVAERALLPVMVAMDGEQCAAAAQDLLLPEPELYREFLGDPADHIDTPTPAQQMLFGEQRRLVPQAYDLERPALVGARQDRASWALGSAGQRAFFANHVQALLDEAIEEYAQQTGRHLEASTAYQVEGARTVVVALGSAIETAEAVADKLRDEGVAKIGVVGLRCLRPFPAAVLRNQLHNASTVIVLERVDAPLAEDAPLSRELRAVLEPKQKLRSLLYGLGGAPLRAADLAAVCRQPELLSEPLSYLGIDFAPDGSAYPKRTMLLERIRRGYPELGKTGLPPVSDRLDLRPDGAITIRVHREAGWGAESFAASAGKLLQPFFGDDARLRSRIGEGIADWATRVTDTFTIGENLRDVGDDLVADLVIALAPSALLDAEICADIQNGGALLVLGIDGDELPELPLREVDCYASNVTVADGDYDAALGALTALLEQRGSAIQKRKARAGCEPEAFDRGFDSLRKVKTGSERRPSGTRTPPRSISGLHWPEDSVDSLPRFWDQCGVLHAEGRSDELSPDPYLSSGVLPPLSSVFRDLSGSRRKLPVFEPSACTGCGDCWTACPDSSIGPIAIGWQSLIDAGITNAKQKGLSADGLRPIVGKLAQRAQKEMAADGAASTAGPLLQAAYDWLLDKMSPEAERREAFDEAMTLLLGEVSALPVANTEPCKGEIFSLAIDADRCKGCGSCVAACGEDALSAELQDDEVLAAARAGWRLWEDLPDTPGETIERLAELPEVGRAAAILMSRHCLLSMAGGDSAEAGSGEKVALRMLLASAEFHLQPKLQHQLEQIDQLRAKYAEARREVEADLFEDSQDGGIEDPARRRRLDRLLAFDARLADLRQRLTEGISGLGRARAGLVVARGRIADWAGAYPYNPFPLPVVVDGNGEAAQLARGLIEGQMRAVVEDFRLLRLAQVELERPNEANQVAQQLRSLSFDSLEAEERSLCPPLLLVGGEELLTTRLPIKTLSMARIDRAETGLIGLAQRKAFVLQSSIGARDHLVSGILDALRYDGPALIHVHAPSPGRDGFARSAAVPQARLAIQCRAFPLFRFDPDAPGVFGARLDLSGNPELGEDWVSQDEQKLCVADWAITERRFAGWFAPLDAAAPKPTPLLDYLGLEPSQRQAVVPFLELSDADGETQRFAVAAEMVALCEDRLEAWRTLQELAGVVTPFTALVRESAEQEIAAEHAAELDTLRSEYEARLAQQRDELQLEFKDRVRDRLATLASRYTRPRVEQE